MTDLRLALRLCLRHPLTFALVAGILATVAIAATLIPARRAMTINPIVALRDSQ